MILNPQQLEEFKTKLLEEKTKIENELKNVGEKDPHTPNDWVPSVPDYGGKQADPVDVADKIEEMGERVGIEEALEGRLERIKSALEAIENGKYGKCHEGDGDSHDIPLGRLEANPAATTCIEHTN